MIRYIAFLRAINVAGHVSVKMTDLKRAFGSAGCQHVSTVIQSGNVLFEADRDTSVILRRIQRKLNALLGSEVTIVFRTFQQVARLVKAAPFKDFTPGPTVKFYVAFLSQKPGRTPRLPLRSTQEGLEAFRLKAGEVFIVSRRKANGMFGFPNNFIERELGISATTRNWTTLERIVEQSA